MRHLADANGRGAACCALFSSRSYSILFRLAFCLLFFATALPLHARPQVVVILADHLTFADVTRPDLPNLTQMRRQGLTALMSPGLAQKPNPVANVYATLGAGDTVRVGDVSQGRMGETLRRTGVRTALISSTAGLDRSALLFLPSPDVTQNGIPPAQFGMAARKAFQTCNLVVIHFSGLDQGNREAGLHALDHSLGAVHAEFRGPMLFVVPTPPLLSDGSWNQLTPFLEFDAENKGSLAHSDTTQTDGLIASRDIAPSVLAALDITPPLQMTGAAITASGQDAGARLPTMDRLTRLNQEAQNPIFWTIGLGAALIVFSALGLYLTGRLQGRVGQIARYGLRLVSVWPLALLLAPLTQPHSVVFYFCAFVGLTCLLAWLPSPAVICALTAVLLVGDGFTGTRLISNSALSEYALSGIRFYGIGNEYMGMLIAGGLLACALTERKEGTASGAPTGIFLFLWFALVTFVLSFPAFGAKAGGAITATAAFAIAWRRLQGRPVTWKHLLGSVACGFALVFVWGLLSHVLHLRRTHLETAVGALGQGRFGYIVGVSLRKIGLAARVALHPGTLLGLAAFALLWLAARRFLWEGITDYLTRHPKFAAVWSAGLWGCLVAVLFNDSGIVAAILMLQCLVLSLLHEIFGENRSGENTHASARA